MTIVAVYLDLTDVGCARLWRWLRTAGHAEALEVRPFCTAVPDPWRCTAPPLSLELLMLVEQARSHGPATVIAVVDAAVDLLAADDHTAAGQLSVWLAVRRLAGLGLDEYDEAMDRLRAEVGLWQAEAVGELGVQGVPALVLSDRTVVEVRLDHDVLDRDQGDDLLRRLQHLAGDR